MWEQSNNNPIEITIATNLSSAWLIIDAEVYIGCCPKQKQLYLIYIDTFISWHLQWKLLH